MVSAPHEAATHEDEGQRLAADVLVGRGVSLVELLQDVVAQADGLFHALHADALLGEAGDREGAGDRTHRDDQVVEGQLVGLADERRDRGDLAVLVDAGDPAGEHLGSAHDASQRDDDVARRDAACGGFGEEGLVRHVRARVDDRDGRFRVTHLLQNASRCVQAYVPATYYEDPGTLRGAHAIEYPPARTPLLVRPFTRFTNPSATLRGPRDRGHGVQREPRRGGERCSPLLNWPAPPRARVDHCRGKHRRNASTTVWITRGRGPWASESGPETTILDPRAQIPCEELHEVSRAVCPKAPRRAAIRRPTRRFRPECRAR